MILLLALACTENTRAVVRIDGPVTVDVLPAGAGPFDTPAGFVANSRSGVVSVLDLKTGRFLTDDPTASFLGGNGVALGRERLLGSVAAVADGGSVDVWAVDVASGMLLRAPYVLLVDEEGAPREVEPTASEPVFVDADGSGDQVSVSDLKLRPGATTTEDWSIEYDGTRWWAKGSRSGQQDREPVAGTTWWSDFREIEFDFEGTATLGDRIEFRTETGVDELDLGARVLDLAEEDGRLWVGTADGRLHLLDAFSGALRASLALGEGAQPGRMAPDGSGGVFVADAALPWVHHVAEVDGALVDVPVATAAPILDVAWSAGERTDGEPYAHLFVAPVGLRRVDVWDLDAGRWLDPNPATATAEGVDLAVPILGLGASPGAVRHQVPTSWGAYPEAPIIAVTTSDGRLFALDAGTGCYLVTESGPKGPNVLLDGSGDLAEFDDRGATSASGLWVDGDTGAQVLASPCGGVTRDEAWTVTYQAASQDWLVEGTISGVQALTARDDVRYVSDTGALSFLILSGITPATDGDSFSFTTESALTSASTTYPGGDVNRAVTWELPGRPSVVEIEGGPTGGGWDAYEPRQYAVVPVVNSDIVARVTLDDMTSEIAWQ